MARMGERLIQFSIASAHGFENVFNPAYVPTTDEGKDICNQQHKSRYQVLKQDVVPLQPTNGSHWSGTSVKID